MDRNCVGVLGLFGHCFEGTFAELACDGNGDGKVMNAVTAGGAGADFDRELGKHRGVQVVKGFVPKGANGAFAWSYGGFLQGSLNNTGPLNLVFKKSNPIFDILARLPATLITSAASGGGPLADLAFSAAANDNMSDPDVIFQIAA